MELFSRLFSIAGVVCGVTSFQIWIQDTETQLYSAKFDFVKHLAKT